MLGRAGEEPAVPLNLGERSGVHGVVPVLRARQRLKLAQGAMRDEQRDLARCVNEPPWPLRAKVERQCLLVADHLFTRPPPEKPCLRSLPAFRGAGVGDSGDVSKIAQALGGRRGRDGVAAQAVQVCVAERAVDPGEGLVD